MFDTPFKNLIDQIFDFPTGMIDQAAQRISSASSVIGQGIDVSSWLAPISLLGESWVRVVNSLLAGVTFVMIVWISKKLFNVYLNAKNGVKWW
ncbi:hypothetical protein [Brevibacillus daliensis]|uniref:hypothetical protein n=1 Tax=Brevibacillus daliensis TaxID=2892995 RepID=UPI001E625F7E|nr:hypothetical protein [Brevibacillus daliensis]